MYPAISKAMILKKTSHYFSMLRMLCGVVFLVAFTNCTNTSVAQTTVLAARIGGDTEKTRFVIDLAKSATYTTQTLTSPNRVIIELGDAAFALPAGAGQRLRGLIQKFTYGTEQQGHSRIVIETTVPVNIEKSFMIAAQRRQPVRLVFDLVKSDTQAVHAMPFPEIAKIETKPPAGQKIIVIDPGHGGADPGAVSPRKILEKDVVLAFGKALKDALIATGGYTVILTRDSDEFLTLRDRVGVARDKAADLFIAIHADIVHGKNARGTTLYTLSDKASDAEAEALAHKENRSDIIAGVDLGGENEAVADVLIDLAQRESRSLAESFAKHAAKSLMSVTLMTGKPIRSAGFVVLKAPDVPSVLVELGYLSSKQDEALMISPAWQTSTSEAMVAAIQHYFADNARPQDVAASP
jgi:N-acetylmuramoyl-L-alanine amidase